MANKRMFSLNIINTDMFLDMPASSQALYYHLGMRADDDGFVSAPKKIAKISNCSEDDLKILATKGYIIPFQNGIVVIKHWGVNNNRIKPDRYKATIYQEEKALLEQDNGVYNMAQMPVNGACLQDVSTMSPQCFQDGDITEPQNRIDKNRIDKDITLSIDKVCSTKVQSVMEEWNKLNLQKVIAINSGTKRQKLLNARLKEYGLEKVLEAIRIIDKSSFLKGQNKDGWIITFDWFLKPSNFIKVLEGNYTNKESENKSDGSTKAGGTGDDYYTELYTTLSSERSE